MAAKVTAPPSKVSAELVSDFGELVVVDKLDAPTVVPAGDYYVSSLRLEIPDSSGQTWTYSFSRGMKQELFSVPVGQETAVALCGKLDMEVTLSVPNGHACPAETVNIRPQLTADGSLYLYRASCGNERSVRSAEQSAEIVLLSPDGQEINRGITGFS
jgi:hypothetical protein